MSGVVDNAYHGIGVWCWSSRRTQIVLHFSFDVPCPAHTSTSLMSVLYPNMRFVCISIDSLYDVYLGQFVDADIDFMMSTCLLSVSAELTLPTTGRKKRNSEIESEVNSEVADLFIRPMSITR